MNTKLNYGEPNMEIIPFGAGDVIAASAGTSNGLINGGTGSGDHKDFTELFPNL